MIEIIITLMDAIEHVHPNDCLIYDLLAHHQMQYIDTCNVSNSPEDCLFTSTKGVVSVRRLVYIQ